MDQIEKVADVLKNWRKYSSPESTSTRGRIHAGIKHIKGHEESVAEIILQKSKSNPNKVILKDRWKNWTWQNLLLRSFAYAEFIQKNFHHKILSLIALSN